MGEKRDLCETPGLRERWLILSVTSLAFFFVTATTFTSLAVVLYTMSAELHWSHADAGLSFSLLGLACGVTSPLPALAIRKIGVRWTMVLGAITLAIGFMLAGISHSLLQFFVAICFLGCAFSLLAPVPGIFLLPRWFPGTAPRIIGFYFMAGAFGGVIGPVLVNASVTWTGNWRQHWDLMAAASVLLALLCAVSVRNRADSPIETAAASAPVHDAVWTIRSAAMTHPFIATAFAMLLIQTALTIINSVLVPHVIQIGGQQGLGAWALALVGLTGTVAKGIGGAVAQRVHPLSMLLAGLVLACAGLFMLGTTHAVPVVFVAAALFGTGWGISWLGAHLFLLRSYGPSITPDLVALATTLTTAAVIGPTAAGFIADRTGSFSPIFLIASGLLVVALASTLFVRREGLSRRMHGQMESLGSLDPDAGMRVIE